MTPYSLFPVVTVVPTAAGALEDEGALLSVVGGDVVVVEAED
jgi:hypothetical protein